SFSPVAGITRSGKLCCAAPRRGAHAAIPAAALSARNSRRLLFAVSCMTVNPHLGEGFYQIAASAESGSLDDEHGLVVDLLGSGVAQALVFFYRPVENGVADLLSRGVLVFANNLLDLA